MWKHAVVGLTLVAVASGCSMFVPSDFKQSEAADAALLAEMVRRHTLGQPMDEAKTWEALSWMAGSAEIRARWCQGESVDLKSLTESLNLTKEASGE